MFHLIQAQVVRPFTIRYNNNSVRGNIVYVSNSIISSTGGITSEVPPSGTSSDNGKVAINIDIDNPSAITKLPFSSVWNYHSNGAAPANDVATNTWKQSAYALTGAAWNTGATGTGAGKYGFNSSQNTCIPNGSTLCTPGNGANKYLAYYFRNSVSFTATELSTTYSTIRLNMKRNDGIVIYINGVERVRNNMISIFPTPVVYGDLAASDIPTTNEDYTIDLSTSFFTTGVNTIAVEIHTDKAKSSDMAFDLQVQGLPVDNSGTFNSSSSDLNLTSCSHILWAGLYWGADQGTDGTNTSWITNANTVKLKLPGASTFTTVTSNQTDYHSAINSPGLPHTGYLSYADITSLLNSTTPNGTYTIADVTSPAGIINSCGGWTIVIAYSNPALAPRNLTVFDGSAIINGGDPAVDVAISGFLTPPTGIVTCEIGAVVLDGDRGSGDAFAFAQNGAGSFYDLATTAAYSLNGAGDAWNSKISYKGSVITTRSPAYYNTLGYDASIMDLPNTSNAQLSNNQTSATIRFSSPTENYFVQVLSTSISTYAPEFAVSKGSTDLNGGSLIGGDIIRYRIDYQNVGNDVSTNSIITDAIPTATSFVPGSIKINGVAKTDASADDQAEYDYANRQVKFRVGTGASSASGGMVSTLASGYVEFDVYAASACQILSCGTPTNNIARIDYNGQTSGIALNDSSGYLVSGCLTTGPISNVITGGCFVPKDTIIVNACPSLTVTLPVALFAGYTFYSAMPFTSANAYNYSLPITQSGVYYAYFNAGTGCLDTIIIRVYINPCPDIDDDNDGIPDYVEGNGVDPSADADSDGTQNYIDVTYPGFADTNGDGVNDNFDADLDGIPNHLDLDSDNDGIPDVVESFGVDINGDGRIDNYTDTDNDGLSQNVDANNTGVASSGTGLGAVDTDGDGIPNYFDLDSDNDGIPDVVEAYGTDANNDGKIDSYTDLDGDGYSDNVDGDVGNDGVAENAANALLKTGADTNNDGRADSFTYKNADADGRPNPYDLDSDGDGITDVVEAGFTDVNLNGVVDGPINTFGWNTLISSYGSLSLPNRDGVGKVNVYDIDADDDGIPDNIEGLATTNYLLPSLVDTDGDGIDNSYDDISGFGGKGINPVNTDGDAYPDYLDFDTDGDGLIDRIEGNDFNFNKLPDDNVTLTGLDADSDGLDDRFDADNLNDKVTSAYMGNGGTTSGPVNPGSTTVVQKSYTFSNDRDWRAVEYVLNCDFISFRVALTKELVNLNWTVVCKEQVDKYVIERSLDGIHFYSVQTISGKKLINENEYYETTDDVTSLTQAKIYYRIKALSANGKTKYTSTIFVLKAKGVKTLEILPNPIRQHLQVVINSNEHTEGKFTIINAKGNTVSKFTEAVNKGYNVISYNNTANLPDGNYYLHLQIGREYFVERFVKKR